METVVEHDHVGEGAAVGSTMVRMTGEPSDLAIARRAAAGDLAAFEELYRAQVGRVYALCLRLTADSSLAEELTQEAFVRAWQRLGSFRGASAFSTWMHRLTVNVVLGHHRARSRRPEGFSEPEAAAESAVAAPAAATEEGLDLERAILRLPERAREVFVLHDVEGHSHDEIAELAGMAVGTSKAHLHRARRLLREALTS